MLAPFFKYLYTSFLDDQKRGRSRNAGPICERIKNLTSTVTNLTTEIDKLKFNVGIRVAREMATSYDEKELQVFRSRNSASTDTFARRLCDIVNEITHLIGNHLGLNDTFVETSMRDVVTSGERLIQQGEEKYVYSLIPKKDFEKYKVEVENF